MIETFYTFDDELNIIQKYSRKELIDRINDYILNFEEKEEQNDYLIKNDDIYSYADFTWKLSNTYSREHLFLVTDENNKVLYQCGTELYNKN